MYAELRLTVEYGDPQAFIAQLQEHIGLNTVHLSTTPTAIAAEQIRHKALILYFLEGRDTIVAQISARTVAENKRQAVRIARQLLALLRKPSIKSSANAVIYLVDSAGYGAAIVEGNVISRRQRYTDALTDRWLPRVLTPGIVLGLTVAYVHETSFPLAAAIGFFAAAASVLVEGITVAFKAEGWEWRECKNDT